MRLPGRPRLISINAAFSALAMLAILLAERFNAYAVLGYSGGVVGDELGTGRVTATCNAIAYGVEQRGSAGLLVGELIAWKAVGRFLNADSGNLSLPPASFY